MNADKRGRTMWIVAGVLGGAVLGYTGVAVAQNSSTTTTPPAATAPDASGPSGAKDATRPDETPLTGDTADKVTAAAQAAVPGGTVDRVETDSDGSPYEAHVTKADGTRVTVKVDAGFKVTSIDEESGHGGRGHGGGRGDETPLTGDTAAKVTAAAQAAVPGGTVDRVETDSDGSPYEAHVTKADGTRVTVKVDAGFNVTSVDEGR